MTLYSSVLETGLDLKIYNMLPMNSICELYAAFNKNNCFYQKTELISTGLAFSHRNQLLAANPI